ncbi:hypothetical protein [Bombella mellum]|uniref:hypothetical protein n=1 Tax=Bombella mellum TaxID=2039288 RepID=UPI0015F56A4E|nr:hypothetical protein [Bombella mellum]
MITEGTVHGMILSCSTPAAHGAIATWLKDFGPIICSVASFWLAYRVSRITREQKEINKSAYNLNLFKERFAIYGKFKTLSDDKNIIYDNIPYNYLKEATVKEAVEYLKKLYRNIDEIFILFKDCEAINTYLHDRKDNFLKLATSLQKRKKIEYFLPEIDNIRTKTKLIRSSMREGYSKYESYHYIYSHINTIIKIISKNDVEDFYIKDNYTFLLELSEKMAIIDTRVYDLFISGEDQVPKKNKLSHRK